MSDESENIAQGIGLSFMVCNCTDPPTDMSAAIVPDPDDRSKLEVTALVCRQCMNKIVPLSKGILVTSKAHHG